MRTPRYRFDPLCDLHLLNLSTEGLEREFAPLPNICCPEYSTMAYAYRVDCLHKPLPVRFSQLSGSLSHQSRQYRYRRRHSRACRTSHCRAQVQHHMQDCSLLEAMIRIHTTRLWQLSYKGASIFKAIICPGWCHQSCCWQDSCKGASIFHMHDIWTRSTITWQRGSVMLQRSRPHPGSISHLPPLHAAFRMQNLFSHSAYLRHERFSCCRHLVGIAGMPGSGKTTAAAYVIDSVNRLWKALHGPNEECARTLPMDGEHSVFAPHSRRLRPCLHSSDILTTLHWAVADVGVFPKELEGSPRF